MVHISQLDEQHGSWPLGPPAAATTVRTFCQDSLNLGMYNSANIRETVLDSIVWIRIQNN